MGVVSSMPPRSTWKFAMPKSNSWAVGFFISDSVYISMFMQIRNSHFPTTSITLKIWFSETNDISNSYIFNNKEICTT